MSVPTALLLILTSIGIGGSIPSPRTWYEGFRALSLARQCVREFGPDNDISPGCYRNATLAFLMAASCNLMAIVGLVLLVSA